jgi:ribonuclease R
LKLGEGALPEISKDHLAEIAARISAAERRAMAAERETVDRLIAHHLVDQIGACFEARISGVTRSGLFVRLQETGADGFVPASTLGREYYAYDERAHALTARSGQSYRLADIIKVRLLEAAPLAGALRFEVAEGGQKRPSLKKAARRPLPQKNCREKRR